MNKYSKHVDTSRCPNIKIPGVDIKPASPMLDIVPRISTRVRGGKGELADLAQSLASPISKLPEGMPLTPNPHSPCIAKVTSSDQMLPQSLRHSGILSPSDGKSKPARIKSRNPLKVITRPTSEKKLHYVAISPVVHKMCRPQSASTLRISTQKEPADTTQTPRDKKEPVDTTQMPTNKETPAEHKSKLALEILRRNSKTQFAEYLSPTHKAYLSPTHKERLCTHDKTSHSISPKNCDVRSTLMRKLLETKVKKGIFACELEQLNNHGHAFCCRVDKSQCTANAFCIFSCNMLHRAGWLLWRRRMETNSASIRTVHEEGKYSTTRIHANSRR